MRERARLYFVKAMMFAFEPGFYAIWLEALRRDRYLRYTAMYQRVRETGLLGDIHPLQVDHTLRDLP